MLRNENSPQSALWVEALREESIKFPEKDVSPTESLDPESRFLGIFISEDFFAIKKPYTEWNFLTKI